MQRLKLKTNGAEWMGLTHLGNAASLSCYKTYPQEVHMQESHLYEYPLVPKKDMTGMIVRLHLPGALVTSGHLSGAHWSLV